MSEETLNSFLTGKEVIMSFLYSIVVLVMCWELVVWFLCVLPKSDVCRAIGQDIVSFRDEVSLHYKAGQVARSYEEPVDSNQEGSRAFSLQNESPANRFCWIDLIKSNFYLLVVKNIINFIHRVWNRIITY